ncbi:MAG: hypothetical protein V2I76_05145, partial [Roseobacter sp.]|nr:hypothetical protein [Roseobacter sp.]
VAVPTIRINATVPAGARTLDPLILAQDVAIEQNWQVNEDALSVGDAVVRTLEVAVTGTSALFVPDLLSAAPPQPEPGTTDEDATDPVRFLSYPEDADVTESFDRAIMSGTRTEQVSYIAQSGGEAVFPDITVSWYNIDTGEVEDIVLSGRRVLVQAPPRTREPLDLLTAARYLALLGGCIALIWAARRWLWQRISAGVAAVRQTYAGTAQAAHRAAVARARAQDLNGLLSALELRASRGCPPHDRLAKALRALTRAKYRNGADTTAVAQGWRSVAHALKADRPGFLRTQFGDQAQTLPALNPYEDHAGDVPLMSRSHADEG